MKPNKTLAAGLAAALAAGALSAIGLATSASAVTVDTTTAAINGSPQNMAGVVTYGGAGASVSLTASQVGTDVLLTVTGTYGPHTSAFAGYAGNDHQLQAFIRVDGSADTRGTVIAAAPTEAVAVSPASPTYASGFTATATVPGLAVGSHTFTLTDLVQNGNGASSGGHFGTPTGFDAFYNPGTTTATIVAGKDWPAAETLNVTAPATASIVSSNNQVTGVTDYVRGGAGINATISGADWTASVAAGGFTAAFCDVTGTTCDTAATNTLSSDGSGALSGTVAVAATTTKGARALKIVEGGHTDLTPVTVLDTPTLVVSPVASGVGGTANFSGTNWNPSNFGVAHGSIPNPNGFCAVADGPTPGAPCNDPVGNYPVGPYVNGDNTVVSFTATATGTVSGSVTINDPRTTKVQVSQKSVTAGAPTNTNLDQSSLQQGASIANNFTVPARAASILTSTAQADGAQYLARNGSGGYARSLTLTGYSFSASDTTGTVEFCDVTGTTCDTTGTVTDTLVTDANGVLSGGIDIPAGVTTITSGDRAIKVTGLSPTVALIPVHVLGEPTVTVSPASGVRNSVVTVEGAEFNTGQTGSLYGSQGITFGSSLVDDTTDGAVAYTASATGTFTKTLTVSDLATKSVVATQGPAIAGFPSVFQPVGFDLYDVTADTTAPTGTAVINPKARTLNTSSTLTVTPADNAGAAYVTATINWGDGSAAQTLAIGAKTATHKYTKLGSFTAKVTLKDQTGNTSAAITAGTVKVSDLTKPVVKIKTPSKATKGSSWSTIKGTVTDAGGAGAKSVTVKLVLKNKKDGKWYYFSGTKWKKASTKAKAFKAAKSLTDTSVSAGWSVKAKKPAKGTLYIEATALDKANNKSATAKKTQKIKS